MNFHYLKIKAIIQGLFNDVTCPSTSKHKLFNHVGVVLGSFLKLATLLKIVFMQSYCLQIKVKWVLKFHVKFPDKNEMNMSRERIIEFTIKP